ncbi:conserved hypothetical protein [Verticillium alfalfae VaMs.102]|uniref:RanBP2-type domain-containing protein n=1 Tax=Verticillium alfalfae (strain VaMs.102 / ATCC MYA-4576 / FGSC 10136) TaxID=526221 RepID=C9SQE0_VERA1|nr:conserved hypothetical protein [Verticillium alfalfae VaMs.102]EEY21065.1 conserved hypothetical protein [Verticillium alfalfae VaMs.102]
MKGHTGEGFLSEGHRLGGGGQKPMHEARRLARAAQRGDAPEGHGRSPPAGQRLGGAAPSPGQDIRRTIAGAAERRKYDAAGVVAPNGFLHAARGGRGRPRPPISQRLWEARARGEKAKVRAITTCPKCHIRGQPRRCRYAKSWRAAAAAAACPAPETRPPTSGSALQPLASSSRAPTDQSLTTQKGWTCGLCTLHNPATFLACDACGTQRGEDVSRTLWTPNEEKRRTTPLSLATASASASTKSTSASIPTIDLTDSPPSTAKAKAKSVLPAATPANPSVKSRPQTWQCSFCGTRMEREWVCGLQGSIDDDPRPLTSGHDVARQRRARGGGGSGPKTAGDLRWVAAPQTKDLQDLALLGAWGGRAEPFPGAKFDLEGSLVPSVSQRVSAGPRMGNPLLDHWQRGQSHLALVAKLHPAR